MLKSATIKKSVFSTDDVPPEQRKQTWAESISVLFDVSSHQNDPDDNTHATLTSFLLNDQVMFTHSQIFGQKFERGAFRTARDGLDYYLIQTILSGDQEVSRGSKSASFEEGDLLVIDLADRHKASTSDFEHLTLVLPRHLLAPKLVSPDNQEGRILKKGNPLATLVTEHMKTLYSVADRMTIEEAALTVEPAVGLIASALNGSTNLVENDAAGTARATLQRAKMFLEENLQRPNLSPDELCKHLNLSRASVYRLFAPVGGISNYIQERRLQRCAEDIVNPHFSSRRIYEIAYAWGFTNESHFSRVFKRRFDISPSDLRQTGISATIIKRTPVASNDEGYESWLADTLKS